MSAPQPYGAGSPVATNYFAFAAQPATIYLNGVMDYSKSESREEPVAVMQESTVQFIPDNFLTGIPTRAVNEQQEVMPLIVEAFEKLTQTPFPADVLVNVCSEELMAKHFGPGFDSSIQGFCRNKVGKGVSEVFVKKGDLAHVMLTAGHELGHAMTKPLGDQRDEEAKAFAFSLAWMDCIRENDIGGLQVAINPRPAENGLHNVAFNFVISMHKQGKKMMKIFEELCEGVLTINRPIEQIILEV